MNFSEATLSQLYEIAFNDKVASAQYVLQAREELSRRNEKYRRHAREQHKIRRTYPK